MSDCNDSQRGKCVEVDKVGRAVEKREFGADQADKAEVFGKGRKGTEEKEGCCHKNRVEKEGRAEDVLKKRGQNQVACAEGKQDKDALKNMHEKEYSRVEHHVPRPCLEDLKKQVF